MPSLLFVPLVVLAVLLPVFIVAEYRAGRRLVLPLKLACSLCFLAVGIIGISLWPAGGVTAYAWLILAGLAFSLLGDAALVWINQKRLFMLGIGLFLLAQVCYGLAFTVANGLSGWDALVFIAVIGLPLAAYTRLDMDVGSMKIPVLAYVIVIAFMFTKALSTLYLGGLGQPSYWLAPLGAGLFFLSDCVLALHKFHRRPWNGLRAVNLVTYYAGQVLLALTVWF